ncbi:MAG: hypothetical protein HWN80_02960 [Candidatus Lokiarchaeota archaeon]|nr:hypothetical protein [Candidatus Lokiarchaeota archaeon]
MAFVNKKIVLNNKKLSRAIMDAKFNNKYHENYDLLLKKKYLIRDYIQYSF